MPRILHSRAILGQSSTDLSDLKILLGANLVSVEKKAQQRIYRMNPMVMFKLDKWSNHVKQKWNRRLDALDAVLKNEMENMINNHDQEVDDEPKS